MGNILEKTENDIEIKTEKVELNKNTKNLQDKFKYPGVPKFGKSDFVMDKLDEYMEKFDISSKINEAFEKGYFGIEVYINNPIFAEFLCSCQKDNIPMLYSIVGLALRNAELKYLHGLIQPPYFYLGNKISGKYHINDPRFQQHNLLSEEDSKQIILDFENVMKLENQNLFAFESENFT